MSAAPRMTFNGIWPTMLIKRQPPGFEEGNAGLEAHIAQQEAREKDYTARYQEQNFFASRNKSVLWLREPDRADRESFPAPVRHRPATQLGALRLVQHQPPGRPSRAAYAPARLPERHLLRAHALHARKGRRSARAAGLHLLLRPAHRRKHDQPSAPSPTRVRRTPCSRSRARC
jgi:hypothetical protein